MTQCNRQQHLICPIQYIEVYEFKSYYLLFGTNYKERRRRYWLFKVSKLSEELDVDASEIEYDEQGKLATIEILAHQLEQRFMAYGLVGFVRFLHGYYMILITKRKKVAIIGSSVIYKIEDTVILPLAGSKSAISIEDGKYLKLFVSVDLSSNFYFSYSYDLSHTLQYNLSPVHVPNDLSTDERVGIKQNPCTMFIWNSYLQIPLVKAGLQNHNWFLNIISGFIGQSHIYLPGSSLYLTIIARRSAKYAGTRYLKRGSNSEGYVANEVEIEQILNLSGRNNFTRGHYTSFVQVRGSVPAYWSQDITKMIPKPEIKIDLGNELCKPSTKHFARLFAMYGSPLFCFNLVKRRRSHRGQEYRLSHIFKRAVNYANLFLADDKQIQYVYFDMAAKDKKKGSVMESLARIAQRMVSKIGIFVNGPELPCNSRTVEGLTWARDPISNEAGQQIQTGVVRVNCVDCLDRTNTAQFSIGMIALCYQLRSLGVVDKKKLDFETDIIRLLEELYDDCGDTLALQYGGSQLVHRVKSYRKTAKLSSHRNDIVQSISRYYRNAFSDAEKQDAINLFLGVYKPSHSSHQLEEQYPKVRPSDAVEQKLWLAPELISCLPRSFNEVNKYKDSHSACLQIVIIRKGDPSIDTFNEYFHMNELTFFDSHYSIAHINHSSSLYVTSNDLKEISPFISRDIKEKLKHQRVLRNAERKYQDGDTDSSDDDEASIFDSCDDFVEVETIEKASSEDKVYKTALPNVTHAHSISLKAPSKEDELIYKRYIGLGINAGIYSQQDVNPEQLHVRKPISYYSSSSSSRFIPEPFVDASSATKYSHYLQLTLQGPTPPANNDHNLYKSYVQHLAKYPNLGKKNEEVWLPKIDPIGGTVV